MIILDRGRKGKTLHLTNAEFGLLRQAQAPRTTDGTVHNCMPKQSRSLLKNLLGQMNVGKA